MSGIFGILRFDGAEPATRDLERMAKAMAHRGIDGSDAVVSGPAGLGHCLMRVTNEDRFDAQPIVDRDAQIVLAADCRLDNRDRLANALGLAAQEMRELPDSAVILCAYKKWGEDFAVHLLGDFAVAVWDAPAGKLMLARDHMGQRGLFYRCGGAAFVFASDRKALLTHPDVPQIPLTDVAIGRLLIHDTIRREDETPPDGIFGFAAGTVLTVRADAAIAKRRYWEPCADPAHEGKSEAYYVEAYRRVLAEAVACRLSRLTAPPGLIFSGGYDSAAIAALAGGIPVPGDKLIAAASVMPADYRGTIRHARHWVDLCKRDMPWLDVRYVTREGKSILSGLEQHFGSRGTPAGNYTFVQTELLSTLAKAGSRCIMDGHGGDYTLNPRGHASLALHLKKGHWRRFFAELPAHRRLGGRSWWTLLKADVAGMLLPNRVIALWRWAKRGFRPAWSDYPIAQSFARTLIARAEMNPEGFTLATGKRTQMREQMRQALRLVAAAPAPGLGVDAAYHGLDLTRPFHDRRVVELALAIPESLYVKNGRNRYLACMALRDLYPTEFQTRWRKNDDEIPDFQRMAKSIEPVILADIARMENSKILARYIDFGKMRGLLAARPTADDHCSGWERQTLLALGGYLLARYIEWSRRDNA